MKKRSLALILVLVLVASLFAGCGKKDTTTDTGNQTTTDTGSTNTDSSDTTDDGSTDDTTAEDEWTWPLAEKAEIGVWMSWDCPWNDSPAEQQATLAMQEKLNIQINWVCPGPTEATEKFGLMMAAGDYPDIIMGLDGYYSGGSTQAEADGVIVDLTELIPQYMPTYEALRNSLDSLAKDTKTDDGRSISVYTINTMNGELKGEQPWSSLTLRKDWLDELGLEVPTTVDEWYTVLQGFKSLGCESPLMLGSSDALDYAQNFLTAYGVTKDFYQEDGVVKYGPQQEGYKQWVELFRKWYAEGLIDQNFVSNDATIYPPTEYIGTGQAGASANFYSWTCDYYVKMGVATDPDFWLVAAPAPVLNEGDTPQIAVNMGSLTGGSMSVTTNCEDVELACRFLDYMYTKEAMEYTSYGIEGVTYNRNEDGSYSFTGEELNNLVESGEYPTLAEALKGEYCLHNAGMGMYNWYALSVIREGEPVLEAYDIWDVAQTDMVLPAKRTLTAEELVDYNTLYAAIQTLTRENTIKFITGVQDMDQWDKFQEDLVSYGVEQCIAYQQAALDRYNAR